MTLESTYQRKVIARYEKLGYYVIKLIRTNKNGIPDLLCLKPNEVLFVEVKGRKTILSPLQKFRIEELQSLGFPVTLDRSET